MPPLLLAGKSSFLSTPSARRATARVAKLQHKRIISIHALREEGDPDFLGGKHYGLQFLSTPSARRATHQDASPAPHPRYFYPRPPRGGRPPTTIEIANLAYFYPRPPRGGRPKLDKQQAVTETISIHALREEGDIAARTVTGFVMEFLSTPSARRATAATRNTQSSISHFYPRPPRGGRLCWFPHRAAVSDISIHALREEGDGNSQAGAVAPEYFYPRPPRGGRPCYLQASRQSGTFLSTPSARRATSNSAHILREVSVFLSTPSARRAT